MFQLQQSSKVEDQYSRKNNGEIIERNCSLPRNMAAIPGQCQRSLSGSLLPEHALSLSRKFVADGGRESLHQQYQNERNYSGPLYRQRRYIENHTSVTTHALDNTSEGTVIQRKGRFKVTSADVGSKGGSSINCLINPLREGPNKPTILAASVLPSLRYILQQNTMQREKIFKLIKHVEQTSGHQTEVFDADADDFSQISGAPCRERELQLQVLHLQQSVKRIFEELQILKRKNALIEQKLNVVFNVEKENRIRKVGKMLIFPHC